MYRFGSNENMTQKEFRQKIANYASLPRELPDNAINTMKQKGIYYNRNTKRFIRRNTAVTNAGTFKGRYKGYKLSGGVIYSLDVNENNTVVLDRIYHKQFIKQDFKGSSYNYFYSYIKQFFKDNFDMFRTPWMYVLHMKDNNGNDITRYMNGEGSKTFKQLFDWPFIRRFFLDSAKGSIFDVYDYVKITITKILNVTPEMIKQNFRQGVSHCVIEPIKNWASGKIASCKSESAKKKYKSILNKCTAYEVTYADGIPQDELQSFCSSINIDMSIYMPLGIGNKYGSNLLTVKTQKSLYGLKHFKYINTRINHVDILQVETNEDVTIKESSKMLEILEQIRKEGRVVPYRKVRNDIIRIHDTNKNYRLQSSYNLAVDEFEKLNNMGNWYLYEGEGGTATEKDTVEFIKKGLHYNCCIDINNTFINVDNSNYDNVRHIDMEKAYYNYRMSKYYDGFLHTASEFRVCDIPIDDAVVTAGMYMINNVCTDKCKKYVHLLAHIQNYVVYPHPEIKFFRDIGVTFNIIAGAYGTKRDIKMTENMKNKYDGIPNYSRWVGMQAPAEDNINYGFTVFDFDDSGEEVISNMAHAILSNGVAVKLSKNEYEKKITMKFKKQFIKTRRHITAYITAYQRIATIQQAMLMDRDDIIRICVDGIYFQDNGKYKNMKMISSFVDDHDRKGILAKNYISTYGNAVDSYITNGYDKSNIELITARYDSYVKFHEVSLLNGAGGCGKTYKVLSDMSHFNVVYLAHSKNLSADKYIEFKNSVRYSAPYQHLICGNNNLANMIKYRCNLLFCDEASTYGKNEIKKLMEVAYDMGIKIMFSGDIGFQIDPFTCESTAEERLALFEHIQNCDGINYRFKDDKIHDKCMREIRTVMTETKDDTDDEQVSIMLEFLRKNGYKTCTKDDVIKLHTIDDMILTTMHTFIHSDEYKIKNNEKFKHIKSASDIKVKGWNQLLPKYDKKKYRINKNSKGKDGMSMNNGQIIISDVQPDNSNETYAFTTHSVQGMSTKNKLFIDTRGMNCPKVLYTAVSRSTTRDNIYLVA